VVIVTDHLQGIIFDMDGVLVDSEFWINKAACLMFKQRGCVVKSADFTEFIGTGENRYLGGVAKKYDLAIDIELAKKETYDIYLEIIKGKLVSLPGVHDFIHQVKESGFKIALATSADMRKAQGNLMEISLHDSVFDAIVTGEDVENKKPAPDIFLKAAKLLNIPPQYCLVVEDAITGVTAAKAAGAKCLALTTSFTAVELGDADFCAKNLGDVPEDALNW